MIHSKISEILGDGKGGGRVMVSLWKNEKSRLVSPLYLLCGLDELFKS